MIAFRLALSTALLVMSAFLAEADASDVQALNAEGLVGSWRWNSVQQDLEGNPMPGANENGWLNVTDSGQGVMFEYHSSTPGTRSWVMRNFRVRAGEGHDCIVGWGGRSREYGYCKWEDARTLATGYVIGGSVGSVSLDSRLHLDANGLLQEELQRRTVTQAPQGPRTTETIYLHVTYERLPD